MTTVRWGMQVWASGSYGKLKEFAGAKETMASLTGLWEREKANGRQAGTNLV